MSLSSFLIPAAADKGKGKSIDKGLDDIFRITVTQPGLSKAAESLAKETAQRTKVEKKRKLPEDAPAGSSKRSKSEKGKKPDHGADVTKSEKSSKRKASKHGRAKDLTHAEGDPEDERAQSVSENVKATAKKDTVIEAPEDEGSDEEGDPSCLVHESLLKGSGTKGPSRNGKTKYVPPDETPESRDSRTVFVGNVPVEVATSRPLQKQFKRHILSFIPTAKIESVRFRSVAFKNPTSQLPTDDDSNAKKKPQPATEKDKGREHDRERAATWRATQRDEDEPAKKTFMTDKEKKRVAFIKHEIHEGIDAVNAYVVFAHPPPAATRAANLPPPAPVMDPREAAEACVEKGDGSLFMERTIRVDCVRKDGGERGVDVMKGDVKATVFVGNLDFASKEEDLRVFFEGLVSAERGPPAEEDGAETDEEDEEEDEEGVEAGKSGKRLRTWVRRVRIIRDKDTQLGKGFAYVQFADRECVDEILALEQDRLKFAKRKLRVQRCKTLPGGTKVAAGKASRQQHPTTSKAPAQSRSAARSLPAPKGNPALGAKISHLPKDERKKVKAADAERVARRMAKKKAKTLAEKGVKARVDRERVRKRPGEKKGASNEKPKRRVRSSIALAKMNTKK